ncbi:tRNAse Z3 [Striga asiatica]|uniref:ribonuclease Z n=1 Tax=Striga asiatica TaxID=4170 RepID=A0A5A7R4T3_STRAF|nr:tRNAse Z3 [Striga asiatica]
MGFCGRPLSNSLNPLKFSASIKMPQSTNLRFLLSSANHRYRRTFSATPLFCLQNLSSSNYFPLLPKTHKPHYSFPTYSSYSKKPYYTDSRSNKNSRPVSRNPSPLPKIVNEKVNFMEEKDKSGKGESGNFGFNRKRAEGRDWSERPKKNLHLKVRKLNPANTISYVQILGTGMDTQDTSPSVLLFFDKQRIIFNAGEGLQRFCNEHKIKLSKIDHIFLSRVCSETAGGLPGLLLTLAGMGDEGIGMTVNVWGPSDLKYLVNAMRSFIPNAAMVHTRSFGHTPDSNGSPRGISRKFDDPFVLIDDEVVKISAVILKPSYVHPSDVMGPSVPGPIVLLVDCPTLLHFKELSSLQCLEPYFIDTGYDVPEGSKLVNCVIHLTPACITQTDDYQKWMLKFGAAQHIMAGHEMKNIEVPILKASARIATRLNYLCPQFFPSPGIWSLQNSACPLSDSHKNLMSRPNQLIHAENLLKFHLRPYSILGLDRSCIPSPSATSSIINELLTEIPEVKEASKQVSHIWSNKKDFHSNDNSLTEEPWMDESSLPSCLENISREEVEIVLLGTGSSQPSKYRNVSSIFINLFSRGSLLLDCGEGTLGQLKRRFGVQGADEAIKNLKCIWISHIHADHHTGLARILALRRDLLKESPHEPIIVVGPKKLKLFLDAYQRLEDLDMRFLDCWHTTKASLESLDSTEPAGLNSGPNLFGRGSRMESYLKMPGSPTQIPDAKFLRNVLLEAGLEGLISFPVVHCPQAFGVVLQGVDRVNGDGKTIPGWKIVYSGDTRPCPELVEASRGATATFEDGMIDEAIARNHSTTKEAVEVGDSAGAYRIILTHFSQRYPKIPVFDQSHAHNTCIAFDLMSVNLADVHVLPRVVPHLKLLFKDEMIVDESEDVELATAAAS